MDKTIKIGNKNIPIRANGLILLAYKRDFGREMLTDMLSIYKKSKSGDYTVDIESLNIETVYKITYTLAKLADPNIGSMDEWLSGFDCFPIYDALQEIMPIITDSITTDAKLKKQIAAAGLRQTTNYSKQKKSFLPLRRRG